MPETKTRKQKLKKWLKRNSEPLIVLGTFAGLTGVGIWLAILDSKDETKRIEAYNRHATEMNAWLNDQRNSGNGVYALDDGRYLVVPLDAPQETVIR